ncbi:hypothetical protein QUF70_09960, partial [Desulfobacterales bacterium HSG17]|nr:hypothetical protein [Desulfobacterales bacterium HSG17]
MFIKGGERLKILVKRVGCAMLCCRRSDTVALFKGVFDKDKRIEWAENRLVLTGHASRNVLMIQAILRNLDIRRNETAPTFLLLFHSFFFGLTIVFIESTASALFLAKFNIGMIPYAYVAGAIVTTLLGLIYSRLEEKLSPAALFQITILSLAFFVFLLRIILSLTDAPWPAFIIFMWIDVLGVFLALQFWGLCERIFDLRQGKRLFGFISSGEVLGGIAGGILIKYIVHITGTPNLLWFTVVWMILGFGVLRYIIHAFPEKVSDEDDDEDEQEGTTGLKIFRERYFFLLMLVSVISIFSQYFIDYAFYDRTETRYSGEDQLAGFFGMFWAAVYISSLVVRMFISGKVLTRLGVRGGLIATPVVMTFGILAAVAVDLVPQGVGLFFWVIMMIKLFDEVVRPSVDEPAILTLYQPLSPMIRHGVQAKVEGVIEPAASGIAGLALICINLIFPLTAVHVTYIMFPVLALWLWAGFFLGREYGSVLGNALTKRYITASTLNIEDGESLGILKKGLTSSHPAEVLYSLHLLEEFRPDALTSLLIKLFDYPDAIVRRQALITAERHNITKAVHKVREMLASDEDSGVRGKAVETLCAISEPFLFEELSSFLHHPETLIQKGAIVGFLKSGGIEGIMAGGEVLIGLVRSPDTAERRLAAEVVGDVDIRSFYRPL